MVKKSFVLGKTQVTIMQVIKDKYPERYVAEQKYAEIFGKNVIKKIHKERLKKAKEVSQKYKARLMKNYGTIGVLLFHIVLAVHIGVKKAGSTFQSLLYFLKLDTYTYHH